MGSQETHRAGWAGRRSGLLLVAGMTLALAGCQESGGNPLSFLKKKPADAAASAEDAPKAAQQTATKMVERDVEAPQVFSVDEQGLWDGRPSLGGVWVAYPDVKDPERVIIRNPKNGKFVIGALFRREADNPGPKLQVSSDAADALGLLAGAPAELSVVALRRETAPVEDQTTPLVDKPVIATPEKIEQGSLDAGKTAAKTAGAAAATMAKAAAKPAKPAIGEPPAPAPAPAPPVAPTQPKPKSSLAKPFVQIGIFSVEANANRTVDQMSKAGVIATVKKESSHDKTFWRVVAGPAPSKGDLDALRKTIQGLGYPDAYPVSN